MTPDIHTNQEFYLDVGDEHRLYVHDWGNNKAKVPIIFLHGGPGAGCNDGHKQNFDPTVHRVIFFDQRGSGRSTPLGSLTANTTQHLISDIDMLAGTLGITQFHLFGRSWGSFLALAYAINSPHKVASIVTGGIITGTKEELDLEGRGERYQMFFPEAYEIFINSLPAQARKNPLLYCAKKILSNDPEESKAHAYQFSQLMVACLRLDDRPRQQDYESFDPAEARVENHFKLHGYFVAENFIMKNTAKLTMPIWIVQGRYDILCVPEIAYKLQQALPNSKLLWTTAGHSGSDRATVDTNRAILLGSLQT